MGLLDREVFEGGRLVPCSGGASSGSDPLQGSVSLLVSEMARRTGSLVAPSEGQNDEA